MSDGMSIQESPHARWFPSGQCSLLAADIASSSAPDRTDDVLRRLRNSLYDLIDQSFAESDVPFGRCYSEDRGDGLIVAVPLEFRTSVLVAPLMDLIGHGLEQHNRLSSAVAQIKLRVALHIGEVTRDEHGLVGTAVNLVFRLLEAPALKAALGEPGASLAFIASERVHDDVIRHGRGLIYPSDYRPAEVRVKETVTTGWIRILRTSAEREGAEVAVQPHPGLPTPASGANGRDRPITLTPNTVTRQIPPAVIFEIVQRFLDVPVVADTRGRDQVVQELRGEIAAVIPRSAGARLDMLGIVRTCLNFPDGLAELMDIVRLLAGDSLAIRNLQQTIGRMGWGRPMPPEPPYRA